MSNETASPPPQILRSDFRIPPVVWIAAGVVMLGTLRPATLISIAEFAYTVVFSGTVFFACYWAVRTVIDGFRGRELMTEIDEPDLSDVIDS